MMAGFGACQEIRLKISCSGSRSKLHLEPYGAQSIPKPCFAKIGPCQEAMPCRPSWISPDKKPMCSGVGCLQHFFPRINATPRFGTCRPGQIFNDFWSFFDTFLIKIHDQICVLLLLFVHIWSRNQILIKKCFKNLAYLAVFDQKCSKFAACMRLVRFGLT